MSPIEPHQLTRQHAQLRRLARAIVGESYADDIVQEALTAALTHPGPAPRNWGAWLNRVTRNLAWKSRVKAERAHARERDRSGLGMGRSSDHESPESLIAEVEEKHALERELLGLEEPYRSALLLRFYGSVGVDEIAKRAGQNPSTTRTHIKRGLERMRERLEKKNGADWRAAIVPLLGRGLDVGGGHAAVEPGTRLASGSPVSAVALGTAVKIAAAAAVLVAGGWALKKAPSLRAEPAETTLLLATAPATQKEESVPEELPIAAVRTESASETPAVAADAEGAAVPAPSETTTVVVREAASGLPLPGVTVQFSYAYMKRRSFFLRSTEFANETATTDASGMATLPVETDSQGRAAENALGGSIRTGDQPAAIVHLQAAPAKVDGVLALEIVDAMVFRVRLPEALSDEETSRLAATLLNDRGRLGLITDARIHEPIAVEGRDLVFAIPRVKRISGVESQLSLRIATTSSGPSFRGLLPEGVNLASEPIDAERSRDLMHTFRVVHSETGEPLPSVTIGVGQGVEDSRSFPQEALGHAGEDGAVRLLGIAPGKSTVCVRAQGFQEFREERSLTAGGSTEIRLSPEVSLRSVQVEMTGRGDKRPLGIHVSAFTNDPDQPGRWSQMLTPVAVPSGGWKVSAELEGLPDDTCFLEARPHPRAYDPIGPVRLEPGQKIIDLDFGEEHRLTSVRLRLPDQVTATFQQRAGDGRLYTIPGEHVDGSVVGSVEDDGRAVTWIVTAPGFLPVVGTEADWRRVQEDGAELIEITPRLEPGWGVLVGVGSLEWDRSIPFHFAKDRPIEGATIFDATTGKTLGVTDGTGFTVITASEPVKKLGARYAGESKSYELKGASRFTFGF